MEVWKKGGASETFCSQEGYGKTVLMCTFASYMNCDRDMRDAGWDRGETYG
jgi:hypothetical protein